MRKIESPELPRYIDRVVRIVYFGKETIQGNTIIIDNRITEPVQLIAYDKSAQTVTFQRPNGLQETKTPIEVFDPA
jgi:hypothetical protein